MGKIGFIDVDSWEKLDGCFPNLPLMKLSAYHKSIGDECSWYDGSHYDLVYKSKVFSFTPDYPYPIDADEIKQGGEWICHRGCQW